MIEYAGVCIEHGLLCKKGSAQALPHLQHAGVGLLLTGKNFEKRGFARAVSANQADALVFAEGEVGLGKKVNMAKCEACLR
jgi:hypothetical protein